MRREEETKKLVEEEVEVRSRWRELGLLAAVA